MTKGVDPKGLTPEMHCKPAMHQDDSCCGELGLHAETDFSRKLEIQPARLLMSLRCVWMRVSL